MREISGFNYIFIFSAVLITKCLLATASTPKANPFSLTIEPRVTRIRDNVESATVTCLAVDATSHPAPLVGCQFFEYPTNRFIDLSHGKASKHDAYEYHGAGLDQGVCGVTLGLGYDPGWVVLGCRVRVKGGAWQYEHMLIHITGWDNNVFNLFPRKAIVLPGTDVNISGKATNGLDACEFFLPSYKNLISLSEGPASTATKEYRYYGDGLPSGQCGVTLLKVTPKFNGVIVVDTRKNNVGSRTDFMTLIVATPPDTPVLSVRVAEMRDGETLHATCVVANGRPMANLTWLLGDDVVRQDGVDESPAESEWRWSYDKQTITQHLSLPLTSEDDGKELWCQAGHIALPTGTSTSNKYKIHLNKQPPCGLRIRSPSLIAGGQDADVGEFPWHAALYLKKHADSYEQVCGATLIKPGVVITAAHCVYDERYSKVSDPASYKVVLGKLLRDWSVDINDKEVQRMDVVNISVPQNYRGRRLDFRDDIAILRLTAEVVLTLRVNVACVDWDQEYKNTPLTEGNQGVIAGWGVTSKDNSVASTLQWVQLPWVDMDKCHDATPLETRKFLTPNKFCAGFLNNSTSVCKGDSGGGLVFKDPKTNRYFLRGIVSTNLVRDVDRNQCNSQLYTSFTSVANFMRWVKQRV